MPPQLDLILALAGVSLATGAWVHYLSLIPKARVPLRPRAHILAMSAALICAGAAVLIGPLLGEGWSIAALVMLPISWGGALGFFYLLPLASLPEGEGVVTLGDRLPNFQAVDHRGVAFDSASLAGQRVLLKFFRGHW